MKKKGFTLIELFVVIFIVSMLSVTAIKAIKNRAKTIEAQTGKNIEKQKDVVVEILKRQSKTVQLKTEKPKIVEKIITKIVIKHYEWKSQLNCKPSIYQLVLIKLDNGIITTGRLNNKDEWKIETDKNKILGGRTVEVVSWKEINID